MAQEIITTGTLANDGTGDPLRTAFQKVNNNFTQIFNATWVTTVKTTIGNNSQELLKFPVDSFKQGSFQINSFSANTSNSQNITINSTKTNAGVQYTGYGTLFTGDPLTNFSVLVSSGNIMLYADPMVSDQLNHFITYQVTKPI